MEWVYIQVASLVGIVAFIVYMAVSDSRLDREKGKRH